MQGRRIGRGVVGTKKIYISRKKIRHQWFWLRSVYLNMVLGAEEFFF